MSPTPQARILPTLSFPRVSGDEPARAQTNALADLFSPRERG